MKYNVKLFNQILKNYLKLSESYRILKLLLSIILSFP